MTAAIHSETLRFIRNGVSNIISGGASALLAVVLPYFFVRAFSHDEFSLWILVLQLAALVNFLNFGIQVAIGRYVAHWLSLSNQVEAENVLTVGLQVLSMLAGLGVMLLTAVGIALPYVFSDIQPEMIHTARIMLFWIGGSLVLGLPFSAFLGVFVGVQRNDIPAAISLISKSALALTLILVAKYTSSLSLVSQIYCAITLLAYATHLVLFRTICPTWHIKLFVDIPHARKEIISYCLSLTVWSVATLLINGISATIVSIFAFQEVAALGVALNAVAFFSGMFRSFQSPILQIFTKHNARGDTKKLLDLFDFTSVVTSLALIVMSCWLILPARSVFLLWVGPQIAPLSIAIFAIMVVANAARNTASAYATYLLALGEQRKVYISPFLEGVANCLSSIWLASQYGAVGVAYGACIGAVVGVAANFVYNFAQTMPPEFSGAQYFRTSILQPALLGIPMYLTIGATYIFNASLVLTVPVMILATCPALWRAWRAYRDAKGMVN